MSLNLIFHISDFDDLNFVNNISFFISKGCLIFLSEVYIYIYIYIYIYKEHLCRSRRMTAYHFSLRGILFKMTPKLFC